MANKKEIQEGKKEQQIQTEESEHSNEHEHHEHDNQAEVYEYQMLMQQFQQMQQTFATVSKHREELRRLESNIGELSRLKGKDNGTMIPLGSGIYIKGSIDETDSVHMNVGSGVVVKKSFDEALDTIRKQLAEVEGFSIQVEQNIQQVASRLQELQAHLKEHEQE